MKWSQPKFIILNCVNYLHNQMFHIIFFLFKHILVPTANNEWEENEFFLKKKEHYISLKENGAIRISWENIIHDFVQFQRFYVTDMYFEWFSLLLTEIIFTYTPIHIKKVNFHGMKLKIKQNNDGWRKQIYQQRNI